MGMGGGGASQITAHVHSNGAGQGGALDADVSLIDSLTIDAFSGRRQLIERFVQSGTASSKTFTISPALLPSDVTELILVYDLFVNGATELRIKVNGIAGVDYTSETSRNSGSAETYIVNANLAFGVIIPSGTLTASDRGAHGEIHIQVANDSALESLAMWHFGQTYETNFAISGGLRNNGDTGAFTDLDSVEILISASTWKEGSNFTLYQVRP